MNQLIQVSMFTLPHKQLRSYCDIGDWQVNADNSPAVICAADTGHAASNAAILLHEFVEAFLCWKHGVKEEDVTNFDQEFFKTFPQPADEPGNDPTAPYYHEHQDATKIERMFLELAGVSWAEHSKRCDALDE